MQLNLLKQRLVIIVKSKICETSTFISDRDSFDLSVSKTYWAAWGVPKYNRPLAYSPPPHNNKLKYAQVFQSLYRRQDHYNKKTFYYIAKNGKLLHRFKSAAHYN